MKLNKKIGEMFIYIWDHEQFYFIYFLNIAQATKKKIVRRFGSARLKRSTGVKYKSIMEEWLSRTRRLSGRQLIRIHIYIDYLYTYICIYKREYCEFEQPGIQHPHI